MIFNTYRDTRQLQTFFQRKKKDFYTFYTIKCVYLCSYCILNRYLTYTFNLVIYKVIGVFPSAAIFKSRLLNMAATVMT